MAIPLRANTPMSHSSARSRTALIAATLAALLAAGLGTYHLRLQQTGTQAGAGAAARSRQQAMAALMALPELRAWSDRIEKHSGGTVHAALIDDDPLPRKVNGKSYWQFSFVANSAGAAHRWDSFLVGTDSAEILVEDAASGELLSLERWRAETQPMQRDDAD